MLITLLSIAAGGAVGAVARYLLSQLINTFLYTHSDSDFMFGTLSVNIIGCFFIGMLFAYLSARPEANAQLHLFLGVGLLGAFTTFSTFSLESFIYIQQSQWLLLGINMLVSVCCGLLALIAGYQLLKTLPL